MLNKNNLSSFVLTRQIKNQYGPILIIILDNNIFLSYAHRLKLLDNIKLDFMNKTPYPGIIVDIFVFKVNAYRIHWHPHIQVRY